jgi:aryl-alcohol dehydrogenase-like predicted oxidoreductase
MGMSDFYGPAEDDKSIGVIHHALDKGVTFLDTADAYGPGKNEELVGKALKGKRDKAFLATKFAIVRHPDGRREINGKPEYVQQACEASLKRLGVDHIDLYYQHRVDRSVPIEDTIGAMKRLVEQGKVRYLGMSEASVETIRRAYDVHPISALQSEYSLWTRDPEGEHLALCEELGITLVAYSPLGRGFLTGAIRSRDDLAKDDWRLTTPRFSKENFGKNLELVAKVEQLAKARGITAAQLALAWVLSRSERIVTIPGTRSKARIDENAGAADLKLSDEELQEIDAAFPRSAASGGRYDDAGIALLNG